MRHLVSKGQIRGDREVKICEEKTGGEDGQAMDKEC